MKKSVSELSLTMVVIVAFVIVSEVVLGLLGRSQNFIVQKFTSILGNESVSNTLESIMDNNVVFVSDIENNMVDIDISNLFKHGIELDDSFEDIDDDIVSRLDNLTTKNIKSISHNKNLQCISKCDDVSSLNLEGVEYKSSYYSFDDYYVVNVQYVESNNAYSFVYKKGETWLMGENYSLYSVSDDEISNKQEKVDKLAQTESSGYQAVVDYDTSYISMASVSELAAFSKNESLANKVYYDNIESIVILNTFNNEIITNSATGFFVSDDLIVTSFQYIKQSLQEGNFISALTNSQKSYDVLGVVALDSKSDLAVLKIAGSNGAKVKFDQVVKGEEILLLGTFGGFGISGQVGLNLNADDLQTNVLYTVSENIGSPLFDSDGNVVGMVTGVSNDKTFSKAISSELIEKYLKVFANKDYYTLKQLAENFYLYDLEEENVSNTIAKSVWDEYKKIGNLDETILLSIVKGSQAGNKISVRYLNDTSLDEEDVLEEFIFNLMESGYREKLNTSRKKRYVNSEYQVVIFCDFDYITIVMEKM